MMNQRDIILQKSSKVVTCNDITTQNLSHNSPFSKAFLDDQAKLDTKWNSIDDEAMDDSYGNLDWAKKRLRLSNKQIDQYSTSLRRFNNSVSSNFCKDKALLRQALFISQLDDKFLLIYYDGSICLIDQHAADERIGLEKLEGCVRSIVHRMALPQESIVRLSKLEITSIIRMKRLEKFVQIILTDIQSVALREHEAYIRNWCFDFSCTEKKLEIKLLAVPEIGGKKQASVADFIHFLDELCSPSSDTLVHSIHSEPQFIQNILSSFACRYAVMFNETLSVTKCQEIISSLATCSVPFQCAHGRPSIISLMNKHDERWQKDIPYFRRPRRWIQHQIRKLQV